VLSIDGQPVESGPEPEIVWAGEEEALVLHGGNQLRVVFPDSLTSLTGVAPAGGEIRSPMPGRIVGVRAAAGDHVQKGDLLFSLDAMKMEHSVVAPAAGRIKAVHVAPGQQVEKGMIAMLLETNLD
jgi:biotin carboxyl carrier protein